MLPVLSSTDTTSATFAVELRTGTSGECWLQVLVEGHAGGSWILQARRRGGAWVDTDVAAIDANGVWRWAASPVWEYRLTGGTAGAVAHVAPEATGTVRVVE